MLMGGGGTQRWSNNGNVRCSRPLGSFSCASSASYRVQELLTHASVSTSNVWRLAATAFAMLSRLGTPTSNDSRSVQTASPSAFQAGNQPVPTPTPDRRSYRKQRRRRFVQKTVQA